MQTQIDAIRRCSIYAKGTRAIQQDFIHIQGTKTSHALSRPALFLHRNDNGDVAEGFEILEQKGEQRGAMTVVVGKENMHSASER